MNPSLFPRGVTFLRQWSGDPKGMLEGLDESFDVCLMIGYHSEATSGGNPLALSFSSRKVHLLKLNDEVVREADFNLRIAAQYGVPLRGLLRSLCKRSKKRSITSVSF